MIKQTLTNGEKKSPMSKFRNPYATPNEKTKPYSYPTAFDHVLQFNSEIDAPEYYAEFVDTLISAGENDTVSIYFATGGGRDDTMVAIMNLIRNCKAHVIGYLIAEASSAGSFILLNCDEIHVGDHVDMLVHAGNYGSGGDYATVKAHTEHSWNRTKKLLEETYKYFLTDDEINDVLVNNRQMFLDSDEINRRLKIRSELFKQDNLLKQKDYEAQLEEALNQEFPQPSEDDLKKLTKPQLIKLLTGEADLDERGNFVEVANS